MIIYELQQDFNWFGKTIPTGTLYVQMKSNPDRYECRSEGNIKPEYNLSSHTVSDNEEYFKERIIDIDNMIWSPTESQYISII
jgi:hypothetical protein